MSDSRQTTEPDIEASDRFAEAQARAGVAPADIKMRLIERGLSSDLAAIVVRKISAEATPSPHHLGVIQDPLKRSDSEDGLRTMLFGALWCVVGIVFMAVIDHAAAGSSKYAMAFGVILYGAMQFVRGVIQSVNHS